MSEWHHAKVNAMLSFRVLGPVHALRDEQALPAGTPQQRAVLAALVVDANLSVSKDLLVDRVWGDAPPAAAAAAIYSHMARIRRALGEAAPIGDRLLVRREGGYSLVVSPESVDLYRFQRAVQLSRVRKLTAQERVDLLRGALAEWRG